MPGGHGLLEGGATLLSSHARTSPTGDERHSESQSGPTADSVKASQLAAGRSLPPRPDVTEEIQTASVKEVFVACESAGRAMDPAALRPRPRGTSSGSGISGGDG